MLHSMVSMPVKLVFSYFRNPRTKISYTQSPQEELCYLIQQKKEFTQAQFVLFLFKSWTIWRIRKTFQNKKQVISKGEEKNQIEILKMRSQQDEEGPYLLCVCKSESKVENIRTEDDKWHHESRIEVSAGLSELYTQS